MPMIKNSNVKCELCGKEFFYRAITRHLKKEHNFSREDFKKYHFDFIRNKGEGICKCKNCGEKTAIDMMGISIGLKIRYDKFCTKHAYCRGLSPVDAKYWKIIFGMNEEESKQATLPFIEKAGIGSKERRKKDPFYVPSQLQYWIRKTNGDEQEAKRLLSESQNKFSKEICIHKYGNDAGIEKWKQRQQKWQSTLNKKTDEEKRIINSKKIKGFLNSEHRSYSKISQELFCSIYEKIKNDFEDIYFATLNKNKIIIDEGINNEYMINIGLSYRLLDFYIPSIKKCIEYNGEYWHYGEGAELFSNKDRDLMRDNELKARQINILYIRERDYINDKQAIIEQCLRFIYE